MEGAEPVGKLKAKGKEISTFDPLFEILPGTKRQPAAPVEADPYEAVPGATIPE